MNITDIFGVDSGGFSMRHIKRIATLTKEHSLFLFGARGTGKSTLAESTFPKAKVLYINLLDALEEDKFASNPTALINEVDALPESIKYVIIDEIQKLPKLLDSVHLLIEKYKYKKYFILTGSSARKLKMAGVNLLAGRAFVYKLFPFSYLELEQSFNFSDALRWGMLPEIQQINSDDDKMRFLQAYAQTYLKEEIWAEQLVKKLDPFRKFLEVAAQCNGKILNYSKISRDVGADDKTVKSHFQLLEDTLLGNVLEPHHNSFRKRLFRAPKFYFFDIGVARALAKTLSVAPNPGTSYYGELFEQFIIVECLKLINYFHSEYQTTYLKTASDLEVDLVVERPAQPTLLVEIKSNSNVRPEDLRNLQTISTDFKNAEAICLSQNIRAKKIGNVMVYPWQEGIRKLFGQQ